MIGTPTRSTVLVACGIALVVAPALFPIQPVLSHDTRRGTIDNRTELERQGFEIIAYENLSERGQELYVRTLTNGGEYRVPRGEGAPDFTYHTPGDPDTAESHRERRTRRGVVIERPAEADLPPADEPLRAAEDRHEAAEERGTADGPSVEERRRQIARYDLMTTRTTRPPLTARSSLARLLSVVLGVLTLGVGGYLRAQPRVPRRESASGRRDT